MISANLQKIPTIYSNSGCSGEVAVEAVAGLGPVAGDVLDGDVDLVRPRTSQGVRFVSIKRSLKFDKI